MASKIEYKMSTNSVKMPITTKLIIVNEVSQRFSIELDVINNISKVEQNPTAGKIVFSRRCPR